MGKLSKEQEKRITGRMVEEEILMGSRESGIYSTSSGEEEQDEQELFTPVRGSGGTPIGHLLIL